MNCAVESFHIKYIVQLSHHTANHPGKIFISKHTEHQNHLQSYIDKQSLSYAYLILKNALILTSHSSTEVMTRLEKYII